MIYLKFKCFLPSDENLVKISFLNIHSIHRENYNVTNYMASYEKKNYSALWGTTRMKYITLLNLNNCMKINYPEKLFLSINQILGWLYKLKN
jgi:hypothetical protein